MRRSFGGEIGKFVDYHNLNRYYESLDNIIPIDVYYHRIDYILKNKKL